jgi:polysaccharide biosynthesis transport protein
MDTIDRSESPNLPSPFHTAPTPLPALPPVFSGDLATASSSQVSSKTLLRGLTRHWWQILLVWVVVSTPVVFLIYRFIEPTFEAFSTLRVSPGSDRLFESSANHLSSSAVTPYLETQVSLITSDRVLGVAIANPEVVNLATIKESDDARADLRKGMEVEIVKNAFLIRVALELTDGNEAATIVNAVVNSYLTYNGEHARSANSTLRQSLVTQRDKYKIQISEKRAELKLLMEKGNINVAKPVSLNLGKNNDDGSQPVITSISEEQLNQVAQKILIIESEIIKVESDLKARDDEDAREMSAKDETQPLKTSNARWQQQILAEFRKDPEVANLCDEIALAADQRDRAKAMARQGNDPARRMSEQKFKKLMEEYDALWEAKYQEIGERLKTASTTFQGINSSESLRIQLKSLYDQKKRQMKFLDDMKIDKKVVNSDTFDATFVQRLLDTLLRREDQVSVNLEQLDFESSREDYRVTPVDAAVAPKIPTNNKRIKYMAVAPIALLFMILGLFCLLEIKAERIGDPDILSTRVRSEVYALPPLPTARAIRKLSGSEADDQIEQFIQRLDHLRFAVCGNPSELGKGRCVLITSAIGGEGKTTLAAQLAARCGNAGISTLLIDADLRRAALSPLLDVPEGPGLSDVLKEEATTDEVVIPVQGGTFYLLPAGNPIQDTSRIFQNRNLGLLLTRLRQLYDLIIIDSPPVLPVPDALILGRWADGAVLAARYDISRFPQVERARRQLDNAGIAIMGTVINGMRNADSYYGRYSYSRRRSSQPSSPDTV